MTIIEPTLLLDERKCRRNISRMAAKARRSSVGLRPHCKTHQSHEAGRWIREEGVDRIAVSSLRMAEYFAQDGWSDITVAFPVNLLEGDRINRLASHIRLNLLVESVESIQALAGLLQYDVDFLIKVDLGYHRTGVSPQNCELLDRILAVADRSPRLRFAGFLGHAGHTYKVRGAEQVAAIYRESVAVMSDLKGGYVDRYPDLSISVGDTPGCSVVSDFGGVDEIRPGNFVFYDVAQREIGSCELDDIAVALVCPVVALHRERGELVVYGGAVHLSKDRTKLADGTECFGLVGQLGADGWSVPEKPAFVSSLSQEHGVISGDDAFLGSVKVGDLLPILPIHSCLTANLMNFYRTLDGRRIDCMRLADL